MSFRVSENKQGKQLQINQLCYTYTPESFHAALLAQCFSTMTYNTYVIVFNHWRGPY